MSSDALALIRLSRQQSGVTLIELIVSMVVISIALVAVLRAFSQSAITSTDPMLRAQMLAIAEEMLEEVSLKPFASSAHAVAASCARDTWTSIGDYHGYDTSLADCITPANPAVTPRIYDVGGAAVPGLDGYAVRVTISDDALPLTAPGIAPPNCKRITVQVTHGKDVLILNGWRTNYAA
ncbi:type II secretion system GspH family protein [Burkholderiaceae bacterium DAT-1]|nr:type II secretion system GspH family protein [Burkholderiaceae bacterium DAT-1]